MNQYSIKKPFKLSGYGIHSNKESFIECFPSSGGIEFECLSNPGILIKARLNNIFKTILQISLSYNKSFINTVEHLLSAFLGLNISNCLIKVSSDEIPILDGSAKLIIKSILRSGIKKQNIVRPTYSITYPIWIYNKKKLNNLEKYAIVFPSNQLTISYRVEFPHSKIKTQYYKYIHSLENYINQISSARTFGFLRDWQNLKKKSYAHGSNLNNTIVFNEQGLINPPLRYLNECARHKILDFLAMLALLDYNILGDFYLSCSGHNLDYELISIIDKSFKNNFNNLFSKNIIIPSKLLNLINNDFKLSII